MIEVENLCKYYGNKAALDNVSFKVEDGHIYGLLGPNGAGKSTTMNIITGYISASSGSVKVNDYLIGKDTLLAKKSIGYLPEIPPLYPDMTVAEYLNFAAKLKKISKNNRKAEINNVMDKTGITDVANRLIKHLSKGYKQRVGIAQAILGSPSVIILDEPTVGLDPEQIIEIRDLIKSLKANHTVILSSHILSEIAAVCDDCLVIAHGTVVACDTTENLIKMNNNNSQTLIFKAKGDENKIKDIVMKTGLFEECNLINSDNGICEFNAISKDNSDKDLREELSFALSDERILIIELTIKKNSLEDTYLELVKINEEAYQKSLELNTGNSDEAAVDDNKDDSSAEAGDEAAATNDTDEEEAK